MNILFIAQYFPPEMGALAARASELARHWAASGQQVTVLTGFPNYPSGRVPSEYRSKMRRLVVREDRHGYRVVRTWLAALPNRKSVFRILSYISFFLSASLTGSFLRRPDVIIASSPPLLVGLAGWWLAKVKRRLFVLEVRDLWPDSITASGVSSQESVLIRTLRAISSFLYRACDHLVVVTPAFKEEIAGKWGIDPAKISVVTNGVETDLFSPEGDASAGQATAALNGRFVASYIGNFGWAQGLGTVVEAAAHLQETHPEVLFLLVGAGADRDLLQHMVEDMQLSNVRILPQQPREKIPGLIRASDVCLVPLRDAPVFRTVIPSKMLEFMACGRPVILGVDGQARQILEEAGGGVFVPPENPHALARAVADLYADPHTRARLGQAGRAHILAHLSRRQTADAYLDVLEDLTATASARH